MRFSQEIKKKIEYYNSHKKENSEILSSLIRDAIYSKLSSDKIITSKKAKEVFAEIYKSVSINKIPVGTDISGYFSEQEYTYHNGKVLNSKTKVSYYKFL